jgi:hypothetical protein
MHDGVRPTRNPRIVYMACVQGTRVFKSWPHHGTAQAQTRLSLSMAREEAKMFFSQPSTSLAR